MKPQAVVLETATPELVPAPVLENTHEELLSDKPWHVVLLDDDQHSYEYVVMMLSDLFGYSLEKAFGMAVEVDTQKRVIVKTCHLEQAEFHQERIQNYGPDWRIPTCKGSMSAILQRAL
jgi:ATP-dependent Clp protease adaptor protein ClpS